MKAKDIIVSIDFLVSSIIGAATFFILDDCIRVGFAKEIYGVAISTLSIIFPVFFAALALIITSSDDDFATFLAENGHYDHIIKTFKFTLYSIFIALLISIILFLSTSLSMENGLEYQPKSILVVFLFGFSYALFATFLSSIDAIRYTSYRIKYLKKIKPRK